MIYWEDLVVGEETTFGDYMVTREEVLEFARVGASKLVESLMRKRTKQANQRNQPTRERLQARDLTRRSSAECQSSS